MAVPSLAWCLGSEGLVQAAPLPDGPCHPPLQPPVLNLKMYPALWQSRAHHQHQRCSQQGYLAGPCSSHLHHMHHNLNVRQPKASSPELFGNPRHPALNIWQPKARNPELFGNPRHETPTLWQPKACKPKHLATKGMKFPFPLTLKAANLSFPKLF